MRLMAVWAMFCITLDCAGKATGEVRQELFAHDNLWLWWICAFFWGYATLQVALKGTQ